MRSTFRSSASQIERGIALRGGFPSSIANRHRNLLIYIAVFVATFAATVVVRRWGKQAMPEATIANTAGKYSRSAEGAIGPSAASGSASGIAQPQMVKASEDGADTAAAAAALAAGQ